MNQALRTALVGYFYGGDYEEQRDGEEVLRADRACYESMDVIKGESLFSELETAISTANMAHECQGFMRGYEYCLTMLNLMRGARTMTKDEYIRRILCALDRIDDLDKLACIWLYADVLAAEREERE